MKIKTSSRKAKGRALQQYVRDLILARHPSLEPDDVKSTPMGSNGEDVQLSPAARKLLPVSIECKSRASWAVTGPYRQAKNNAPKGTEPVLVIKANREKPLAVVDAEYFFQHIQPKKCRSRK